jgi:hypothetical protein
MELRPQPVATHGNGFGLLSRSGGLAICDQLPVGFENSVALFDSPDLQPDRVIEPYGLQSTHSLQRLTNSSSLPSFTRQVVCVYGFSISPSLVGRTLMTALTKNAGCRELSRKSRRATCTFARHALSREAGLSRQNRGYLSKAQQSGRETGWIARERSPLATGRLAAGRPGPPANRILPGRGRATKRRESLTQSRAHGVRQRPYRSTCRCPWVEGGGSGSRGMSAEQVALVPQCEECLASNDPLTSHPWRLAVGETLVGRSLFRHVDYFGGPGARRRWGETGGL